MFYASTKSRDIEAFNDAYKNARVHIRSALFSPSDIGPLPDNLHHVVSYTASSSIAWLCPEPQKVKVQSFESLSRNVTGALAERTERTLDDSIDEIRQDVLPLLPGKLGGAEDEIRERVVARRRVADWAPRDDRAESVSTEILVIRELVRVGLGVDLLIAQPREGTKDEFP